MRTRFSTTLITAGFGMACLALAASPVTDAAAIAGACTRPGTPASNKILVKKFYAALDTKQKGLLDEVLTENWVDIPMAPGQQPGRSGMKGAMDGYFQSFPDFHVVNQDMVAEGDKVVVRSTINATQKGAFAGIAASNRPFEIMAIDIHQICNGRITRTWHVEDWLNGLFQMGALPPSQHSH